MAQDFKNLQDMGGLFTASPEDKIPDRNASDIGNIDFSVDGLAQTAIGYSVFANSEAGAGIGVRGFIFKKNFGTVDRILLRVRDDGSNTILEWLNASNPDTSDGKWEMLIDDLTTRS